MALIFRSLKLSFPVFLRSLLILPLIGFCFAVVVVVAAYLLGFFGWVWLFMVALGLTPLPILIMIRTALSLLGKTGPLVIGHLVRSSFLFAGVLLGSGLVLTLGTWLSFVALLLYNGVSIHLLDVEYLVYAAMKSPVAFKAIQMIAFLISAAFFAAILVPMAGCASGEIEYQKRPGFFYGFGVSFLPLFLLCAGLPGLFYVIDLPMSAEGWEFIRQIALTIEGPASETGGGYSHTRNPELMPARTRIPLHPEIGGIFILVSVVLILLWIWYYAWVCSAAALAFVRHWEEVREDDKNRFKLRRIDPADLREFRKSRKP